MLILQVLAALRGAPKSAIMLCSSLAWTLRRRAMRTSLREHRPIAGVGARSAAAYPAGPRDETHTLSDCGKATSCAAVDPRLRPAQSPPRTDGSAFPSRRGDQDQGRRGLSASADCSAEADTLTSQILELASLKLKGLHQPANAHDAHNVSLTIARWVTWKLIYQTRETEQKRDDIAQDLCNAINGFEDQLEESADRNGMPSTIAKSC